MKKALVEPGGRVAQVEPINPDPQSGGIPFPVAPPLVWRDCPDDTTTQHTWNGASFDPPPPPPLPQPNLGAAQRQMRKDALREDLNTKIGTMSGVQKEVMQGFLKLLDGDY